VAENAKYLKTCLTSNVFVEHSESLYLGQKTSETDLECVNVNRANCAVVQCILMHPVCTLILHLFYWLNTFCMQYIRNELDSKNRAFVF